MPDDLLHFCSYFVDGVDELTQFFLAYLQHKVNTKMKKIVAICMLALTFACSGEKELKKMVVQGQIKGLKKGILYLQKMKDTLFVTVDSVSVLGKETFTLSDDVEFSEIYYLTLDTNSAKQKVMFFGEPGTVTIRDQVSFFGVETKIEGSQNQKIYEDYKKMMLQFQGKQLGLLEANFNAQKENDLKKSDSLRKVFEIFTKRRYVYAIQFALRHPDSEVIPYIVLTDLANVSVKYLDSINNTLTGKVKKSLYGKKLSKFIAKNESS